VIGQESTYGRISICEYSPALNSFTRQASTDKVLGESEIDSFGAYVAISVDGAVIIVGAFTTLSSAQSTGGLNLSTETEGVINVNDKSGQIMKFIGLYKCTYHICRC
jgi:hypothetical protein